MWSTRIAARTLVAGLTAAGVLAGAAGVAVASASIPTCTVTQFKLIAVGTRGTELGMASATTLCFGTYVFTGVLPSKLGSAAVTTDNYAELAAVLKHWNSIDGAPAVTTWVNLSPTVGAGMKAAGINPTMFLQWINDYNASAWAGTGVRLISSAPPVWPSFVAKGYVSDPATIAGGTGDQAVAAPKPTPPPQATPQQPVTPTPAPKPPAGSASAAGATSGGTVTVSQPTPASSKASAAESTTETTTAKSPKTVAVPTVTPTAPPAAVTAGPVTVPCVVAAACRPAVVAHDRWLSMPWYHKAGLQIWWHRWWGITALAIVAAATLGTRAVIIGRRNLAWYGNVRGPR